MLFKVASLALSAISSANAAAAAAAANSSTKQTKDTPFQLRNNHRRAVAKEMQQQHTSFDSSSLSSTLNMINTKDSSGGDDDTKFKDPLKSVDEGVLSAKVPYNYKDQPLLLTSPSRRLSDTPVCSVGGEETDFIDCENGLVRDTSISCAEACDGKCCEGTDDSGLPADACVGFTGKICPDGSCVGYIACQNANIGHIVNGCKAGSEASGSYACLATFGGGQTGPIESVVDSCHGDFSCTSIAFSRFDGNAGSVGNIIDSCLGFDSCSGMASSNFGDAGLVGNIESSCLGDYSCTNMASFYAGTGNAGNVGDITCSCQGDDSCKFLYSSSGQNIAELSFCCNGEDVCNGDSMASSRDGPFTLPDTCAAGDYTDPGTLLVSTCQVPTQSPSKAPSKAPSTSPSKSPSQSPSQSPSKAPTESPSKVPTTTPSQSPSKSPSKAPSLSSSINPSKAPTESPSKVPTSSPSTDPLSPSGPAYDNEIKVRFYPKSWTGGNYNNKYCSNDGEYPHWMEKLNIFMSTLKACCKEHYGWDSAYEDCVINGGGSPEDFGDKKFYADYLNEYCVQNCLEGSNDVACTNPGGLKTSQPTYTTAEDCCKEKLWWVEQGLCAHKSRTPNEVYVYQGSGKWFPNKVWKDCVQDSKENPMPHWSAHNSHVDLDSCCKTHFSTLEEEGNDGNCPQAKFYGDDNED